MMRPVLSAALVLLTSAALSPVRAQEAPKDPPCSLPEFRQLDFWVGTWDLTWGEDGQGTNVIEHVFGDCVIQENFEGGGLQGRSVSTYDPASKKWRQTWVDSSGSYLDFTGGMVDDRMILSRTGQKNGAPLEMRMIFYNIEKDSLDWDWETSPDGETWELKWRIHYERRG